MHREVQSNVTMTFDEKLRTFPTDCEVLLKEHLPSGLYIDLYQAENLHQFGGPKVTGTHVKTIDKLCLISAFLSCVFW